MAGLCESGNEPPGSLKAKQRITDKGGPVDFLKEGRFASRLESKRDSGFLYENRDMSHQIGTSGNSDQGLELYAVTLRFMRDFRYQYVIDDGARVFAKAIFFDEDENNTWSKSVFGDTWPESVYEGTVLKVGKIPAKRDSKRLQNTA
ncbi:hypothetical protein ANN_06912 [Periplaneta americana]|uniref:Uncharacterized protein n=1 Tax=Periplaneta americana TaxID=6978 RepID=A0ABQ8TGV4_PERAM|nr:hypothetical protein ANN_06912 [Periplaneta americana]